MKRRKKKTSAKKPLLTIQNVNFWYWIKEPPLSIDKIAEKVGCTYTEVERFMKTNKITLKDSNIESRK